ncbi:hypothetical protein ASPZODRAFT_141795 [Penicilliopsis zonata CBS 506.65]|uniref:Uncharacterized protein n=1 Tax=Penicilliopsis zonata CBS 506.65 TaxID=1073090 RepID=A0A1L9SIH1_9EURO|nr:hypothetical protein ASPZODRAFT_141795 [Penicilliopsis zonata CBS 506.65]OJJ47030.1 hypothetical protein ASPZODRAFT_141795 [Penicilliopsis zonata CBS 506.65]
MSTRFAYLKGCKRGVLEELASEADLYTSKKDHPTIEKLAIALLEHFDLHENTYKRDERFTEIYSRPTGGALPKTPGRRSPVKRSPVKKEPRSTESPLTSKTPRSTRLTRSQTAETEESESTSEESEVEASLAVEVKSPPTRQVIDEPALPPSPKDVTDAIDQRTQVVRKSISEKWEEFRVVEHVHSLRSKLSSVKAIESLVVYIEGLTLLYDLIPLRYMGTFPGVPQLHIPQYPVKFFDMFVMLDSTFWAPFSLWLVTSVFLPMAFAYFFNISLNAAQTRDRPYAVQQRLDFDPLMFNISKALIAYLVYGTHFTLFGLFGHLSIERVNMAVLGQWPGMLIGASIGVVGTLYEAILRR